MGYASGAALIQLSIVDDAPLPSEFRVFAAGVNESSKGPAIFDEQAAASVMASYQRWGVDLMIDIDHASLDPAAGMSRRDAGDAVAWFHLEVRDGELWAINIRWNDLGRAQLRGKLRRYISPAFMVDDEGRVTELINLALVAMPATFGAQPLVAASRGPVKPGNTPMDPNQVQAAIDALVAQDAEAALAILRDMIATLAGGEAPKASEPEASDEAPEDAPPEGAAAMAALSKLFGAATPGELVELARAAKASADEVDKANALLEFGARQSLVASLVKLGAEIPATAWEGAPENRKPCVRLMSEPLESLRGRVQALGAAHKAPVVRAPVKDPALGSAAKYAAGMTPEARARYEAMIARRDSK
jgi:phage I-like protein